MTIQTKRNLWVKWLAKHYFVLFIIIFTLLLLFGGTVIFNSYWTGIAFPDLATNLKDRREYITAYISLLSFLGTVEGICIVILTYGDWKTQHKKISVSNDAKISLDTLFELSRLEKEVSVFGDNNKNLSDEVKELYRTKLDEMGVCLDKSVNSFIILSALAGSKSLREHFVNLYADYKILNLAKEKIINEGISEEDKNHYWLLTNSLANRNGSLRGVLKDLIEIK